MTDIPTHDQFALPHELPDSAAPGRAHSPAPGTPSEDWRVRGLAHRAGRGWIGEGSGSAHTANPSPMREGSETCGPEGDVSRSGVGPSDPLHTQGYTVLTPERLAAFLSQLAECGNVRLACRAAGISPQTAYRARRKSAALARQWDAAILAARPIAEDSLADKAMHGWLEAQFYRGEPCGEKYRFDGRLLLAHLGRLDKLAERVAAENGWRGSRGEAAAMAGLDAAIETLERGEALDEPDAVGAGAGTERPKGGLMTPFQAFHPPSRRSIGDTTGAPAAATTTWGRPASAAMPGAANTPGGSCGWRPAGRPMRRAWASWRRTTRRWTTSRACSSPPTRPGCRAGGT